MAEWLSERVSPERLYSEIKWGSWIWFALAAELLKDTLPVAETGNAATLPHSFTPGGGAGSSGPGE